MSEPAGRMQIWGFIGTWVEVVAVVLASIFAVYQFLEHKSAVRVERSMAFVERYQDSGLIQEARIKITDSMSKQLPKINQVLTNQKLSAVELNSIYSTEIMLIVEQESLGSWLEYLFVFYEQILLCRELNLCDDSVAELFLDDDARHYVRTFYPYICHVRSEWNNPEAYAKVLGFYVKNEKKICI